MLTQLIKNLPSRRYQLLGILALSLAEAVFASVSIAMLIPLTQAILGSRTDSVWLLRYAPQGLLDRPNLLFLIFGGVFILKVLVTVMRQAWSGYLSEKFRTEWQVTLSERLIHQPYAAFVRGNRGELISDLTQQTNTGAVFVLRYLTYASKMLILACVIGAMALVEIKLVVLMAVMAVAGWFLVGRLYFRWARKLGKRAVSYNAMLASDLVETFSGIKDIKVTSSEEFKIASIKRVARLSLINKLMTRMAGAAPLNGAEFLFALGILVVVGIIAPDREQLNHLLPLIVFFSAGLLRVLTLAASVVSDRFMAANMFPAFLKVTKSLLPGSETGSRPTGGLPVLRLETPVRFENVGFAYDAVPILQDLDFEVPLGRTVCLFGPSGSGKTTIVDLIMRLFEPHQGRITANGHDIRNFDLQAWGRLVGYVGQEPYLFHGTIEDNLRLGDSTLTPEELRGALARAAILDFVDNLPAGLETFVGSQGAALSGGQKRRIALARALVRKPSLLILDETTNALDEDMERELIASLSATGDLSLLLISHRLVSAQWAEISFVVEAGRVRPFAPIEPKASDRAIAQV